MNGRDIQDRSETLEQVALLAYARQVAASRLATARWHHAAKSDLATEQRSLAMLDSALREALDRLDRLNMSVGVPLLAEQMCWQGDGTRGI
ncbi:MAG: hypothetical protein ABI670_03485 [Chloroflexota bacterium]